MDKDNIIQELLRSLADLTKEVQYLKERLSKYEPPKNSNNSSIPPSQDENRPKRNQSLREKTVRKPGGQKGRKGNTLNMIEKLDIIEKHIPDFCNCCGKDISNLASEFVGKRQIIDLLEIKFHVSEHQIFKKVCSCGQQTIGQYPAQGNAPVSYGNYFIAGSGIGHTIREAFEIIKDKVQNITNRNVNLISVDPP